MNTNIAKFFVGQNIVTSQQQMIKWLATWQTTSQVKKILFHRERAISNPTLISSSLPFLSPSFFPPLSSALTFYRSHSSVTYSVISPGNASYSLHEKLSRDNSDPACSGKEAQDPSNSKKARLVDQLSLTDLNANIFPPDYWDRPLKSWGNLLYFSLKKYPMHHVG